MEAWQHPTARIVLQVVNFKYYTLPGAKGHIGTHILSSLNDVFLDDWKIIFGQAVLNYDA